MADKTYWTAWLIEHVKPAPEGPRYVLAQTTFVELNSDLVEGDMRVLITGGAGFIGSHLAERLIEQHMKSSFWTTCRPARLRT